MLRVSGLRFKLWPREASVRRELARTMADARTPPGHHIRSKVYSIGECVYKVQEICSLLHMGD